MATTLASGSSFPPQTPKRSWLALTVRERLEAMETMGELAARIATSLPPSGRDVTLAIPRSVASTAKGIPDQERGPPAR